MKLPPPINPRGRYSYEEAAKILGFKTKAAVVSRIRSGKLFPVIISSQRRYIPGWGLVEYLQKRGVHFWREGNMCTSQPTLHHTPQSLITTKTPLE
ncbi:MAG: hypothetical protein JWN25_2985 [Verrucomicrobiales bacterium]|nr:hypothetical protein [Verrucomicrobiales bacterium]